MFRVQHGHEYDCVCTPVPGDGGVQGEEGKVFMDVILRSLIQRCIGPDKSSDYVQNAPPADFLWQAVPFQPCCGHAKPPSSLMPAVPGDSNIGDSVTSLIRLLLDDVSEFIREKAPALKPSVPCHESKAQQSADCKLKQHISLPTSTYWCTASPLTTSKTSALSLPLS